MNNTTSFKYHILFYFSFLSSSLYAPSLSLLLISIAIDWQYQVIFLYLHSMQGLFLDLGFSELIVLVSEFFLLSCVGNEDSDAWVCQVGWKASWFLETKEGNT